MKRSLLPMMFVLLLSLTVTAQDITVKSFQLLPTDMTASSIEGKRTDQNGDIAALIKIVTTEKEFVFEGGTLGIVDSQQRKGEVWVWVPRGLRKITILHEKLGVLRDYRFPIDIEAERTYEMVLTTPQTTQNAPTPTIEKEEFNKRYLVFQLTPPNVELEVNDNRWPVSSEGVGKNSVEPGTYTYRVNAPNYYPEAGKVTVDDSDHTKRVDVVLRPKFGWIEVPYSDVVKGATVYVDNSRVGKVPYKSGAIDGGQHKVMIKKGRIERFTTTVDVVENETSRICPEKLELKNQFFFTFNGAYSVAPQWSVGFSFGQIKRYGWFVSVMSDPYFNIYDRYRHYGISYQECDADGFLMDGTFPYYGVYSFSERVSIMAGGVFRISKPLSVKVGVGYGLRNRFYVELQFDEYGNDYYPYSLVRNNAYSAQGLEMSAGVLFDLGGFVVSVDAVTTAFKTLEGKLGLGFCF